MDFMEDFFRDNFVITSFDFIQIQKILKNNKMKNSNSVTRGGTNSMLISSFFMNLFYTSQ